MVRAGSPQCGHLGRRSGGRRLAVIPMILPVLLLAAVLGAIPMGPLVVAVLGSATNMEDEVTLLADVDGDVAHERHPSGLFLEVKPLLSSLQPWRDCDAIIERCVTYDVFHTSFLVNNNSHLHR